MGHILHQEHSESGKSKDGQEGRCKACTALEQMSIRLREYHKFLRECCTPLRLHTSAQHHVALVVQGNQLGLCLHLSIHACEDNFVLPRIHCHHTVVPELLGPGQVRGVPLLRFVHDSWGSLCGALVGVDDCNLRVVQVGKDMGFESHGGAQSIVAMNHQQQNSIVVGQLTDRERPCCRIRDVKFELVAGLEGSLEIPARLVRHGLLTCETLLLAAENVEGITVWVGVAHSELVLELQGADQASGGARGLHIVRMAQARLKLCKPCVTCCLCEQREADCKLHSEFQRASVGAGR